MSVWIRGVGTVCSLGSGIDALRDGLQGAKKPVVELREVETADGRRVQLPVHVAQLEGLDRFVNKRAQRRLDLFTRMALLASFLAVEDSGLSFPDPARVGIVFGSGYGPLRTSFAFQDGLIDDGDRCASPTHFANSVHNAPASQLSIAMGLQGPCSTITCFERTTAAVFDQARRWLDEGLCDHVIAGAGDEFCDPLGYVVASAKSGKDRGPEREGGDYHPGEGFAAFVLARADGPNAVGIEAVRVGALGEADESRVSGVDVVFAARRGCPAERSAWGIVLKDARAVATHTALWGSTPTGDALEIAAATLCIRDGAARGIIFSDAAADTSAGANPNADPTASAQRLNALNRIACLQCDKTGPVGMVVLAGGRGGQVGHF
jgi:3-oxoacyl-[acyl-carrier-protein] synthase II